MAEEGKWVPAYERDMPEKYERVLVTVIETQGRKVRSGTYCGDGCFNCDNGDLWLASEEEFKAWMKLPEPYQGE